MNRSIPYAALLLLPMMLNACSCDSGTGYVRENDVTTSSGSAPGSACTVDADCASGRCQGGVCSTGGCDTDADCRDGEVCVFGECTPDSTFECTADTHPIIDINPAEVDFGAVTMGRTETRSVTVRNLGSCLLTIQGVGFSSTTPADFTCDACEPSAYPRRLPPNRSLTVNITYAPAQAGERTGVLQIRSDDETYPTQMVPLVGHYEGQARFLVEPELMDFGYLAAGSSATRTVRVSNVGDGNAVLTVTDARLFQAGTPPPFASTPTISFPSATVQLSTTTQGATDCLTTGGCIDLEVTFHPQGFQDYEGELVLSYEAVTGQTQTARVQLKGFSTTPPVLALDHTVIDFGSKEVGTTVEPVLVRIQNTGQTPMTVSVSFSPNSSTDISVQAPSPLELPVRPGFDALMRVNYDPTQLGPITAEIRVASNDPTTYDANFGAGVKTIVVRGNGTPNQFNDILKLEMTFENGDSGFFGNDFRDVDLLLEGPQGDLCTKPRYSYDAQGRITGIIEDPCTTWTYGGTPRWQALGIAQEPERIILNNAGSSQGDYTVKASYEEDCASIPTQLLASLLGIGIDVLVDYISGGVIDIGAGNISSFIANNCWDHASSGVTVNIYINGSANMTCAGRLGSKGQVNDIAIVTRSAQGQFSARCVP
ncbi:MAG: choice-of-anchor D domain-containing protein [Deltaproteobacteria bacterium]|nr:choice-of-anchor D domain-containing protein [Deltaproteobacteria bacterium]